MYIYIAFDALNLNGTYIMGLAFKPLNPEDVIRVLERERERDEKESKEEGDREKGNVVRKQNKETSERVSGTVCSERQ